MQASDIVAILAVIISVLALILQHIRWKTSFRPYLVLLEQNVTDSERGIYLRNVGLGPAFNIDLINAESRIDHPEIVSAFREIPRNLLPQDHTMFARYPKSIRLITKTMQISFSYEDYKGNTYKTSITNMKHSFGKV